MCILDGKNTERHLKSRPARLRTKVKGRCYAQRVRGHTSTIETNDFPIKTLHLQWVIYGFTVFKWIF